MVKFFCGLGDSCKWWVVKSREGNIVEVSNWNIIGYMYVYLFEGLYSFNGGFVIFIKYCGRV